jgi:4,4'-diaponeurosporenoate glycosyltransferase
MNWIVLVISMSLSSVGLFLLWKMERLKSFKKSFPSKVSIVIPARNEFKRISPLLQSIQSQASLIHEYIVVDDNSTDGTATLAKSLGAKIVSAPPLPKGWFGKPWACYQGAKVATGDVLMFLDADVKILPQGMEAMLSEFNQDRTPLSIQPYHMMKKGYESLSLFFNLIVMMTTGLFTPLGSKMNASSFFGPCQIISKEDYWKVDGHAVAKHAVLEDMVLGEALRKSTGKNVRSRAGRGVIVFRMYGEGLRALIEGWTKNFATGAKLIPTWLMVLISLWMTGMFISLLSGIAPFMWQDQTYLIGYLFVGLTTWLLGRKVGNFSPIVIVLFPIQLIFFLWLFIRSSIQSNQKKVTWKGRELDL